MTVMAYKILIQEIIAVTVQTLTFVLIFAGIFNVSLTLLSDFFPQYVLFICKNWLPLKALQNLELSLTHTHLTSSQKDCDVSKTLYLIVNNFTHTHAKKHSNKLLSTKSGTFSTLLPKGWLLSSLGCSFGRSDTGVVGGEFFLSSSLSNTMGFQMILLLPTPSRWRPLRKMEYLSLI